MTKRQEIKIIIVSEKELPWKGYLNEPPLFRRDAICLIKRESGYGFPEPLIEEIK